MQRLQDKKDPVERERGELWGRKKKDEFKNRGLKKKFSKSHRKVYYVPLEERLRDPSAFSRTPPPPFSSGGWQHTSPPYRSTASRSMAGGARRPSPSGPPRRWASGTRPTCPTATRSRWAPSRTRTSRLAFSISPVCPPLSPRAQRRARRNFSKLAPSIRSVYWLAHFASRCAWLSGRRASINLSHQFAKSVKLHQDFFPDARFKKCCSFRCLFFKGTRIFKFRPAE